VFDVNKDQLNAAVNLGKDNRPNTADQRCASETHAYYNVPSYWTDVPVERLMATPLRKARHSPENRGFSGESNGSWMFHWRANAVPSVARWRVSK